LLARAAGGTISKLDSWREFYALEARPLGRGGQAEVFKAKDRTTAEFVALKRVLSSDSDALARMRREIEVQLELRHQHIMPVLRHAEDFTWYTMPLAHRALKDVPTPMPDIEIATVARSISLGLQAAHSLQFVHRDITPANILDIGTTEVHWVVSDWGLVRRRGQTTIVNTARGEFGTAGFAAPEMWIDAHEADHLADIFGLGRVVAWAATGTPPIPNVSLVPPGRWKRLVESTTALDPTHRCQSMAEVLELLGGEATAAPRDVIDGVPEVITAIIRAEAEKSFPDNYSTQHYQLQRETEAWRQLQALAYDDVPLKVMTLIREDAAAQFPRAFTTQLYQIDQQVKAFRSLRDFRDPMVPSTVFDSIQDAARRSFPRSYSTQLYQLQRELESWKALRG